MNQDNFAEPNSGARLPEDAFRCVVKLTPLVSIDLIIRRPEPDGRIWLGRRKNQPAKDSLFVPGGRITKNERRADAFKRITQSELGVEMQLDEAIFIGTYDHIYPDNFCNDASFGTHYVTLGYQVTWRNGGDPNSFEQHTDGCWMAERELLESALVHENTKLYFRDATR